MTKRQMCLVLTAIIQLAGLEAAYAEEFGAIAVGWRVGQDGCTVVGGTGVDSDGPERAKRKAIDQCSQRGGHSCSEKITGPNCIAVVVGIGQMDNRCLLVTAAGASQDEADAYRKAESKYNMEINRLSISSSISLCTSSR